MRPVILIPSDDPPQIADSPRLDQLREVGEVVLYRDRPADVDEQVRRAEQATILINSRSQVSWPGDVLKRLPNLQMATVCGIGTDAIDLVAAKEQGVVVCNIPGRTAPIVAEHAFSLMLAIGRRTAFQTGEMKAGRWTRMLTTSLRGKTLGVVGTGNIGCEMIRLARAFGMRVIAWTYRPSPEKAAELEFEYVAFDELLAKSDVISLHVKLTDESRNLIDSRELSLMQPGSLLVNTARGAIINSEALAAALENGHLGGAALDVFDVEPLPGDHPLLKCEQVVLTPHAADQTPEGIDLLNAGCVDNVLAFLAGRPRNVVT